MLGVLTIELQGELRVNDLIEEFRVTLAAAPGSSGRADTEWGAQPTMQIYIDETGNFIPGVGSKISCGVALVVAESKAANLLNYFGRLVARWDAANGGKEVKGSALNEVQMASVIHLASHYDPVLVVCAIDAGNHEDTEIRKLIADQGNKITSGLTEQHHPNLVGQLKEVRANWEKLSSQLAIQAFTFFALVEAVLRDTSLYFAQREPATLGELLWIVDAKDPVKITNYETVWHQMLLPYLQTTFLKEPLGAIEGADYASSGLWAAGGL